MKLLKWLSITAAVALTGCGHDPLDVDTDNVSVKIGYANLDSVIVHTDTLNLLDVLMNQRLKTEQVVDYELGYCLGIGTVADPELVATLHRFKTEPYIVRVEKRIHEKFPSPVRQYQTITEGFRHLKAHFPDAKLPENIAFLNSYFKTGAFATDKDLAIGLEWYLGAKTDVISELPPQQFYEWMKEGMEGRYLERDAVASWVMTHMIEAPEDPNNIEAMIYWGKILYLTEAAFPELPKSVIARYSELDYNWAMENERLFWDYLVEHDLLFGRNERDQRNFLSEGPFTPGLPEKAPDRFGQFLGWRIIQSYMEQYELTLPELMKVPYSELLQEYEIDES